MVEVVRVRSMGARLQAYVSYFRHVLEARRAFESSQSQTGSDANTRTFLPRKVE